MNDILSRAGQHFPQAPIEIVAKMPNHLAGSVNTENFFFGNSTAIKAFVAMNVDMEPTPTCVVVNRINEMGDPAAPAVQKSDVIRAGEYASIGMLDHDPDADTLTLNSDYEVVGALSALMLQTALDTNVPLPTFSSSVSIAKSWESFAKLSSVRRMATLIRIMRAGSSGVMRSVLLGDLADYGVVESTLGNLTSGLVKRKLVAITKEKVGVYWSSRITAAPNLREAISQIEGTLELLDTCHGTIFDKGRYAMTRISNARVANHMIRRSVIDIGKGHDARPTEIGQALTDYLASRPDEVVPISELVSNVGIALGLTNRQAVADAIIRARRANPNLPMKSVRTKDARGWTYVRPQSYKEFSDTRGFRSRT